MKHPGFEIFCLLVGTLLALLFLFTGTNIVITTWSGSAMISASSGSATDSPYLPAQFETTPDRYTVSQMKDGVEAWVDWKAIYVDRDRRMWMDPDRLVFRDKDIFGYDVHIKREGDHIILFKNSIMPKFTWTPGYDEYHIAEKSGLVSVLLR